MDLYKNLIRPILFKMDPEISHHLTTEFLKILTNIPIDNKFCYNPKFEKEICGLKFPNPLGLAAGFDKNANLIDVAHLFGFGFIEIGTVTPTPQIGNPKPRLFRLTKDEALLNFMGFNNDGVSKISRRLGSRKSSNVIIGANIGKNRLTEFNRAHKDYVTCVHELHDVVDYFTINISSPNTQGLRDLSNIEPLRRILEGTQNENKIHTKTKPLFVKISPDMNTNDLYSILDICVEFEISGIVSTNTTVKHDYFKGGLSGRPLTDRSSEFTSLIKDYTNKLVVISSGGVMDEKIASERFKRGADLIQLYTGLIYEGPFLPRKILKNYEY
jgi:dihydroorotate dehydrogenase